MTDETAMYRAVVLGEAALVKELITADEGILDHSMAGKSWLHWAAMQGHTDIMEILLASGMPVDQLTDDGASSALNISASQGNLEATKWLIDHGADLNRGLGVSATPIFSAIYSQSTEVVKLFVARRADLNAVFGDPKLDVVGYSEQFGTPEITDYLKMCDR